MLVKCANVPPAIRTIPSLLYREDKRMWLAFRNNNFSKINIEGNNIMSILRVLQSSQVPPETLIRLWVAAGFVVPLYEGQIVDDAGEEYFMNLVERCFLQDKNR